MFSVTNLVLILIDFFDLQGFRSMTLHINLSKYICVLLLELELKATFSFLKLYVYMCNF